MSKRYLKPLNRTLGFIIWRRREPLQDKPYILYLLLFLSNHHQFINKGALRDSGPGAESFSNFALGCPRRLALENATPFYFKNENFQL